MGNLAVLMRGVFLFLLSLTFVASINGSELENRLFYKGQRSVILLQTSHCWAEQTMQLPVLTLTGSWDPWITQDLFLLTGARYK